MTSIVRTLSRGLMAAAIAGFVIASAGHADAADKKYKIALSNSYIGNAWRVQMINLMNAYAKEHYGDKVEFTVTSTGADVQKQIAAIQGMISQGVDAILINPASDTALNPVIEEATEQGIVVVDFDQVVTAPSAYKINVDFVKMGELHAQWLVDQLGGKGKVIINRGVSGFQADRDMHLGNMNVFNKHPGIEVVTEIYGKWDDGVTQAELTKALTAHPDVAGVTNQAGEYGALQALLNLNYKLIPMTGEGANGWRIAMEEYKDKGLKGLSAGEPPLVGAYALKTAVDIIEGNPPADKQMWVQLPVVTTDNLQPGVNVFPEAPHTLFADLEVPGTGIKATVKEALGEE